MEEQGARGGVAQGEQEVPRDHVGQKTNGQSHRPHDEVGQELDGDDEDPQGLRHARGSTELRRKPPAPWFLMPA